jgi:hypothetical protein
MSRNRFARSVAVSLVALVALFTILLTHCTTSTAPATDTGVHPNPIVTGADACVPSSNPNNPVICIAPDGVADPDRLVMHARDHRVGNPIIWRSRDGAALTLNLSCEQVVTPNCNGPICIAHTNPEFTGTCSYTATVGGLTGSDPIIVTDNCCPAPTYDPKR